MKVFLPLLVIGTVFGLCVADGCGKDGVCLIRISLQNQKTLADNQNALSASLLDFINKTEASNGVMEGKLDRALKELQDQKAVLDNLKKCSSEDQLKAFRDHLARDECKDGSHNCSDQANCKDDLLGFTCTCKPGFDGDGVTCEDVDECDSDNECDVHAVCHNTPGTYSCECESEYTGDGRTCDAVCDSRFFPVGDLGCVTLIEERMTWDAAGTKCQEKGAKLLENIKEKHLTILSKHFNSYAEWDEAWVGIKDRKWHSTGNSVDGNMWLSGQPNGNADECGLLDPGPYDLGLEDYSCTSAFYVLCQK